MCIQETSLRYPPKTDLLKNRIILVTGASDGIGREAALTYARYGASVILVGRNSNKLCSVAQEISKEGGKMARWFTLDLLTCTSNDCKTLATHISSYYSRLDGVLHNAGFLGEIRTMQEQDPEIWKQVMQVNVNGTFFLTQMLLPLLLRSSSGSLVFTSSNVGQKGRANWGAYAVSKFATEGMMQVLSEEYKNLHLRVNCINPGSVRTKMRTNAFPKDDQKRLKSPSEIMPIYLWIMSDDSRCKTGITFNAQSFGKKTRNL